MNRRYLVLLVLIGVVSVSAFLDVAGWLGWWNHEFVAPSIEGYQIQTGYFVPSWTVSALNVVNLGLILVSCYMYWRLKAVGK